MAHIYLEPDIHFSGEVYILSERYQDDWKLYSIRTTVTNANLFHSNLKHIWNTKLIHISDARTNQNGLYEVQYHHALNVYDRDNHDQSCPNRQISSVNIVWNIISFQPDDC